jgi:hypothetical protein
MVKKVVLTETSSDNTPVVTAKLGTASNYFTDADRGKAVKLIGDSNYGVCAAGDEIEGFVSSIENFTADNQTVGSVRVGPSGNKKEAMIAAAGWAIGNYVVADAQAALGTYNDAMQFPRPKVKLTADQVAATISALKFKWRIIACLQGTTVGAANGVVVIERV